MSTPEVIPMPTVAAAAELSLIHGDRSAFDHLSVRDVFALHAMSGYLACHAGDETALPGREEVAAYSFKLADEMLKHRTILTH